MHVRSKSFRPRKIDPFKQLQVIRSEDELVFEDEAGHVHHATNADLASGDDGHSQKKIGHVELPTPFVELVPDYDKLVPPNYKPALAYVRHLNPPEADIDFTTQLYDLQKKDADWLATHPKWGPSAPGGAVLTDARLARIIDIIDKEGVRTGKTMAQDAVYTHMGELNKEQHQAIVHDIYMLWKSKRNKLKKAVIRQYWPPTDVNDTNPHHVFRPREKERYRLRKHRKNDMEAFLKLRQLRAELMRGRNMIESLRRREKLKRQLLDIADDTFDQAIYDMVDTSGNKRTPWTLKNREHLRLRLPKEEEERKRRRAAKQAARRQQRRQAEMMAAQGGVVGGRLRVPTLPPPVRAVEVDRAYADGLGLGVALGLHLGDEHGIWAGDGDNHGQTHIDGGWRSLVTEADVGGMSAVAGIGARGQPWELAAGLQPGVGASAGRGRGGSLTLQPEVSPPVMATFPPTLVTATAVAESTGDDADHQRPQATASSPDADVDMEEAASTSTASSAGSRIHIDNGATLAASGISDVALGKAAATGRRTRVGRNGRIIIDRVPITEATALHQERSAGRWALLKRTTGTPLPPPRQASGGAGATHHGTASGSDVGAGSGSHGLPGSSALGGSGGGGGAGAAAGTGVTGHTAGGLWNSTSDPPSVQAARAAFAGRFTRVARFGEVAPTGVPGAAALTPAAVADVASAEDVSTGVAARPAFVAALATAAHATPSEPPAGAFGGSGVEAEAGVASAGAVLLERAEATPVPAAPTSSASAASEPAGRGDGDVGFVQPPPVRSRGYYRATGRPTVVRRRAVVNRKRFSDICAASDSEDERMAGWGSPEAVPITLQERAVAIAALAAPEPLAVHAVTLEPSVLEPRYAKAVGGVEDGATAATAAVSSSAQAVTASA